jgi:D-glycero-D-manno-heptose 1,7-bisphosphate phosphatase
MGRFVFLDRDGTLVRDTGYPHRLEEYELLPGVAEALARLARAGFRLAVVTNQSGIGRGLFEERDFARFEARLESDLARAGAPIERCYHCPHAPDLGCACRKPAPGLLLRARDELGADLAASWVVGDGAADVELAARAGCLGAVRIGAPPGAAAPALRPPRYAEAKDLAAAAELILAARAAPAPARTEPA